MNWKKIDAVRRSSGPLENDLIDHYVAGNISRRNFVKRGTILGLGVPTMAAIIAACGGDDDDEPTAATGDDGGGSEEPAAEQPAAEPAAGGDLTVAIQFGDANSGLDPLNMLDLGTYAVLSQSFEYLVGVGSDYNVSNTGLAVDWSPNEDATQWTFTLRDGVQWQDGSPFTAADVAATIDRMVVAGAGLAGIVAEGGAQAADDLTVVVDLEAANGNLPVLLSTYNPQSLVTPADYSDGTTLDGRPAGTGAWVLDSFDATTFTPVFSPNPNWWGGSVNLDSVTMLGFESQGTAVAAMQAREIDVIQNFGVVDGASLIDDSNFTVVTPPSANHRQIWFNTQLPAGGPFTDPRVRQAVGYCLNREQIITTLFNGQALAANDHPIHPTLPFFDESAVPTRPRDIEMARSLLADAGYGDGVSATIQVGNIDQSPELAAIMQQNCAEAGFDFQVGVTDNSDFYGEYWCAGATWGAQPDTGGPGVPCGASADIGIVDYGHRPIPDIYLTRALQTDGDWNSSNYADADYDALVTQYQGSIDVEGQTAAISGIQQKIHEDAPALYPYFFNYLGGHDNSVQGVQITALGHVLLQNATKS
ncbi:MAG: ABC transporter substrate-binding protein [Actinomycetota bacterium]